MQVTLESPVSPSLYPALSVLLTASGLVAAGTLYINELTQRRKHSNLLQDLGLAGASAGFLGLGVFFLLLWSGVYV